MAATVICCASLCAACCRLGAKFAGGTDEQIEQLGIYGNALGIAPSSLIIRPCYVGGDFGGKGDGNDVALCYALARKSGRPASAGRPRIVIRPWTTIPNNANRPGRFSAAPADLLLLNGRIVTLDAASFSLSNSAGVRSKCSTCATTCVQP